MRGVTVFKRMLKKIYWAFPALNKCKFFVEFVLKNKYWPDFKNPKTFNEKINFRKNNPKNELFSICADKVAAKEWVASKIGSEYIIPNYFVGDSIDYYQLKEIIDDKGDCLLKANHNSGPVFLLTRNSTEQEIREACYDVNRQLQIDFGRRQNEPWYSKIKPLVLVEKRLMPEDGDVCIRDYKFHVFKQEDYSYKIILEVHFDQDSNHNISYFDSDLNWLPISIEYPNIYTSLEKPINYEIMLEKAKTLASEFTYVRVDFYNINGSIYFGELTFAKTSGAGVFLNKMYDLWMGNFWKGNPSL